METFLFPFSRSVDVPTSVYGGIAALVFEGFLPFAQGDLVVCDFRPQILSQRKEGQPLSV
jgi:hypothetical protein